jgi:hypothetical protein
VGERNQKSVWRGYAGAWEILRRYFKAYGGAAGLLRSPYLHLSVVVTGLSFHVWSQPGWWERPVSILPNVLGFSLGGFAIWLASGDEKFRSKLAGRRVSISPTGKPVTSPEESPYLAVSATFTHYVVVQVMCLIYSLVCMALNFTLPDDALVFQLVSREIWDRGTLFGAAIGYWLFIYAITLTLAAVLGLFRVSTWFDGNQTLERVKQAGGGNPVGHTGKKE